MKLKFLFLSGLIAFLLASCGNDKDVEAKFVREVDKATQQLVGSKTVDDIVVAEDMLDSAYKIQGVDELSESDEVATALDKFEKELKKAQERIMNGLGRELVADPDAPADSIKTESEN